MEIPGVQEVWLYNLGSERVAQVVFDSVKTADEFQKVCKAGSFIIGGFKYTEARKGPFMMPGVAQGHVFSSKSHKNDRSGGREKEIKETKSSSEPNTQPFYSSRRHAAQSTTQLVQKS